MWCSNVGIVYTVGLFYSGWEFCVVYCTTVCPCHPDVSTLLLGQPYIPLFKCIFSGPFSFFAQYNDSSIGKMQSQKSSD